MSPDCFVTYVPDRSARDGADQAPTPPHRPSRQADEPDSRAQRCVERRLQGAIPDRRWPVLLSADGRGWIQPVPLGVPGPAVDGRRRQGLAPQERSEEHTSELQSRPHLVCRLLLEKKKKN